MKPFLIVILTTITTNTFSQDSIGFVDMHVHTTLKNFTRVVRDPSDVVNKPAGEISSSNWKSSKKTTKKGEKSAMFKRIQSDYATIAKEDYGIVVSSISPIEKAHLNSGVKKFMALFAGYYSAVKSRENPLNTPFEYFNSELIYQVNQKQEAGSNKLIVPAKNSEDLLKIISKNNIPVVLTVEGLNALMGDFLSQNNHFQDIRHKPNELKSYAWDFKNIQNELLTNLDSLKNLPYRIFFVSPTHHNWNYITGQAQYFDKNELGGTMRFIIRYILTPFRRGKRIYANSGGLGIIDTLTLWHRGERRERFTNLHSYYDCECPEEPTKNGNHYDKQYKFTCRDQNHLFKTSIGEKVFKSLLDKNNPYGKPIYIDIKHMDIQARLDYYKMLDEYKAKGENIPIIASHVGVSGKDQLLAEVTGLPPIWDDYGEINKPDKFYSKNTKMHNAIKCMPELKESIAKREANMNKFYPTSLNLYDEEIKTIYDSDGMIGLIMDERLLGAYMPYYKSREFRNNLNQVALNEKYTANQKEEYKEINPFLRNMLYVVSHSGRTDASAWDHLSIGSDYDGLVDPLDICLNSDELKKFEELAIEYLPVYLKHEEIDQALLYGLTPEQAMRKVFRTNAYNFILKYF